MTLRITEKLIEHGFDVKSYAYTKVSKYLKYEKPYYIFNFSSGAKPSELRKVDMTKEKAGVVIPTSDYEVIADKVGKDKDIPTVAAAKKKQENGEGWYYHKRRLFVYKNNKTRQFVRSWAIENGYNPPRALFDIKFVHELPSTEGTEFKYDVIVLGKDTDEAAQRRDVRISYLFEH